MKVVKRTGLVPVRSMHGGGRHAAGKVFGVKPDVARKGVLDGVLELVAIPDGVETFDVKDPEREERKAPVPVEPAADVDIPNDWESLHHLKIIALAKDIAGMSRTERLDTEAAAVIIRREIARREALPSAE